MRWMQGRRSRREVLGAATLMATGGLAAVLPLGAAKPITAQSDSVPPSVVLRPNIASLDPQGPEIVSLRRGVATMQQLSIDEPDDPRGWQFQANMHGAPADMPDNPTWRQCQHGSFFFLPWHRMYLTWFERILRWAAADPQLALPYWDYSLPEHRVLPEAFRLPADSSNPLYFADRDPAVNAGVPPWSVLAPLFDYHHAFTYEAFFHTDPLDASFGGLWAPGPVHAGGAQGTGQIEMTPHGQLHVMIGGRLEDADGSYHSASMGDPDRAARDPIFWLHHANIDRLWDRWLEREEGRANPTDDAVWMETSFTFFDEDSHPVAMTAKDVLDTVNQLGYLYDAPLLLGRGPAPEETPGAAAPPMAGAPPTGGAPARPRRRSLLGTSHTDRAIALGTNPVTVPIHRQGREASENDTALDISPTDRLVLSIEGLRGSGIPGVSFEVYVQSAPDRDVAPSPSALVGLLSLFGLQPSDAMSAQSGTPAATQSFVVTEVVHAAMNDPAQRGRLAVTFIPRVIGGHGLPAGPWATIERVAISAG